ncbi:MAG: XTP/dITP diphosphatase [Clostridiales bacterium]|nr:XTP/dITP diphosphatase [Clostridiales bacterium]
MKRKIIFATGNEHKMTEIRQILGDLGWEIQSMKEAGIAVDIVEDGTTFEENALIKATAVAACCDDIVLADDSGLEIDYLNKEPGIYSSRYAGEDTSYDIKNQMLLDRLRGVPREQRTARFVCAVAAVVPGQEPMVVRGTIEGYIGETSAGENGFGYDPIFYVKDLNCSTAQLSPEEKNARSHRGNALRLMREKLKKIC